MQQRQQQQQQQQQEVPPPGDRIAYPAPYAALMATLDAKQIEQFMHHTAALIQQGRLFDIWRQHLQDRGAEAIPLVVQQLRMASNQWEPDIHALVLPIQNTIKHLQSCAFARMADIEEHWGTEYGQADTPAWMPAVHLHGGATPLAPPLTEYAPTTMNMFHQSGAVANTSSAATTTTASTRRKAPTTKKKSSSSSSSKSGGMLHSKGDNGSDPREDDNEEREIGADELDQAIAEVLQEADAE